MLYFNLTNINQEFLMDKAEEKHLNFYSPNEIIQISVKLDEYDEEPIPIKFLKKSYETSIKLKSLVYPNSTLNLYANFSDDKAGCFITFYVKTCFINASSLPLSILDTTKNKSGLYIPSQKSWKNITLASDINFCYFLIDEKSVSEEINVEGGSINGQVSITKKSTREVSELVYTTSLSLIDINQSLYTKIITILPKYVIINKSDRKLVLTQKNLENDDFTIIDSNSREIFLWLDYRADKRVKIKMLDNKEEESNAGGHDTIDPLKEWYWSSEFVLEEMGAASVRNMNSRNTDKYFYWKIDRCIQNDIIFITIQEEEAKYPLYLIENKAKNVILKYKQKGSENREYCEYGDSKSFAWDNLYDDHKLQVEAWFIGRKSKVQLWKVQVDFDTMEKIESFRHDVRSCLGRDEIEEMGFTEYEQIINYRTHTNGVTKILTFDDAPVLETEDLSENHTPELIVNLELEGLGVSLISDGNPNHINERREVLY